MGWVGAFPFGCLVGAEMAEEGKVVRTPEPDKEAHQAAVKKIQDEIEEKQNRMVSADSPALLWAAGKGKQGEGRRRGWLQGRGGGTLGVGKSVYDAELAVVRARVDVRAARNQGLDRRCQGQALRSQQEAGEAASPIASRLRRVHAAHIGCPRLFLLRAARAASSRR